MLTLYGLSTCIRVVYCKYPGFLLADLFFLDFSVIFPSSYPPPLPHPSPFLHQTFSMGGGESKAFANLENIMNKVNVADSSGVGVSKCSVLYCNCTILCSTELDATFLGVDSVRTRIRNLGSGAFLTPGSGMGKKSRSRSEINIPEHISESLEASFWVKNT
jgi:hypothetical protein